MTPSGIEPATFRFVEQHLNHCATAVPGSSSSSSSSSSVACMGERRGVYRVLVGKSEGKRPLGRPRRRWEVNIKVDLRQEVGCGAWTRSSWLRIGTGRRHL